MHLWFLLQLCSFFPNCFLIRMCSWITCSQQGNYSNYHNQTFLRQSMIWLLPSLCVCVLQCWRCDCKGRRTFCVVFFFFFSKVFYSSKNRRELINENIGCFEHWGMSAFVYSFLPFSSIFSSLSCGNDYSQVLFI